MKSDISGKGLSETFKLPKNHSRFWRRQHTIKSLEEDWAPGQARPAGHSFCPQTYRSPWSSPGQALRDLPQQALWAPVSPALWFFTSPFSSANPYFSLLEQPIMNTSWHKQLRHSPASFKGLKSLISSVTCTAVIILYDYISHFLSFLFLGKRMFLLLYML